MSKSVRRVPTHRPQRPPRAPKTISKHHHNGLKIVFGSKKRAREARASSKTKQSNRVSPFWSTWRSQRAFKNPQEPRTWAPKMPQTSSKPSLDQRNDVLGFRKKKNQSIWGAEGLLGSPNSSPKGHRRRWITVSTKLEQEEATTTTTRTTTIASKSSGCVWPAGE